MTLLLFQSRCPSVLLPYLYNQFQNKNSFDVFCTSLIIPSEKPTKEELQQSDVLIRAFIEDYEKNEEVDIHPSVFIEEEEKDKEIEIEIEMEEGELVKKSRFLTFPSFPTPSSSDGLDEDIVSFINQIPGYGTYSTVCSKPFCEMDCRDLLLQYCDQLTDTRVTIRKKAGNAILR